MDAQGTLDELRNFPQRLAPELSEWPPYLLFSPQGEIRYGCATAFATRGHAPSLQQRLIDDGKWRGPAPFIVFNKQPESRHGLLVTLLHEIGHIVPTSPPLPPAVWTPANVEADQIAIAKANSTPYSDGIHPRWIGDHGSIFTRIALHLWWRAALLGEFVDFTDLAAGSHYDMSPCIFYWRALGNEPIKMQGETFDTILSAKPPEDFTGLWRGDVQRWKDHHPTAKLSILEAA